MTISDVKTGDSSKAHDFEIYGIVPVFSSECIPLCFSTDENYAPMLSVTITSLIKNSNSRLNYDIIILEESLSQSTLKTLTGLSAGYENISIRSFNMKETISHYDCKNLMTRGHVSFAAYYRLFIGSVFRNYEKIIYLDSDILILSDLSELYNIEMEGFPCAAALDIGIACLNKRGRKYRKYEKYMKDTLSMPDIRSYFNSGIMIFDLDRIRSENFEARMLKLARLNNRYMHDQNVLNAAFYNNYKELDPAWNYQWQIRYEYPDYKRRLDKNLLELFNNARNSPKIIHYLTHVKPWNNSEWEYSELYWGYADTLPATHRPEKNFEKNTPVNEIMRKSKKLIGDLRYAIKSNDAVANVCDFVKNSRASVIHDFALSVKNKINNKMNREFKKP